MMEVMERYGFWARTSLQAFMVVQSGQVSKVK